MPLSVEPPHFSYWQRKDYDISHYVRNGVTDKELFRIDASEVLYSSVPKAIDRMAREYGN